MADRRVAAEDRRVGVDDHVVLQRRMSLHAANDVAGRIAREAQRAERHALVQLHIPADVARLADDDAGAVVDEEPRPDRRPGVDVDARLGVGELRHHPRDERHPEPVQLVGDAVH